MTSLAYYNNQPRNSLIKSQTDYLSTWLHHTYALLIENWKSTASKQEQLQIVERYFFFINSSRRDCRATHQLAANFAFNLTHYL